MGHPTKPVSIVTKAKSKDTPPYIEHLMLAIDSYIDTNKVADNQLMVALWEGGGDDAGWLIRGDEAIVKLADHDVAKDRGRIGDLGELATRYRGEQVRATLGKIAGGIQILRHGSEEWNLAVYMLAKRFDNPELAQPWLAACNLTIMGEVFDGLHRGQKPTVAWLQGPLNNISTPDKVVRGVGRLACKANLWQVTQIRDSLKG